MSIDADTNTLSERFHDNKRSITFGTRTSSLFGITRILDEEKQQLTNLLLKIEDKLEMKMPDEVWDYL